MKFLKENLKRFLAIVIIILMIVGIMPISSFAKYITDMNSNAKFGVIENSKDTYGHELHFSTYDSTKYLLFCTQFGETSPTGITYKYNKDFQVELKADRKSYEKIAEYIYFGYTMKYGTGLPKTKAAKKAACATQQFVWEYIEDNINDTYGSPTRNSWNSTYMSSSIYKKWLQDTEDNYKSYHNKTISFDGKTKKIDQGQTQTFTDTNKVLKDYSSFDKTVDGVQFKHTKGSNDLLVTIKSMSDSLKVKFKSDKYDITRLMPDGSEYDANKNSNYMYFHFTSGAVQNLMFSNYVDPEYFTLTITAQEVEEGTLELLKTDNNDTPLANCTFTIYSDAECTDRIASATTDVSGKITFDGLAPGKIYIKETSVPYGYLLDTSVKEATIENKKTSKVSFKNNEPTGKILIYKVDSTGTKVPNAVFKITAAKNITNVAKTKTFYKKGEVVDTITSDTENGIATKDNLPIGNYLVQEESAPKRIFKKRYNIPCKLRI